MKQARVLSSAEYKRVIAVIDAHRYSHRNRIIFALSFLAGLRACEIASLRVGDVIDGEGRVRSQIVLHAHMTKGNTPTRVVLNSTLQDLLRQYVNTDRSNCSYSEPLIVSQKGGGFRPITIVQLFAKFFSKAGIIGASSHSGRRQFITALAESQVNVRVIQALARHKHVTTTMRYVDVNDVKLQNAANMISAKNLWPN